MKIFPIVISTLFLIATAVNAQSTSSPEPKPTIISPYLTENHPDSESLIKIIRQPIVPIIDHQSQRFDLSLSGGLMQVIATDNQKALFAPMDGTMQGPVFGIQASNLFNLIGLLGLRIGAEFELAQMQSPGDSGYFQGYQYDQSRIYHDIHAELTWLSFNVPLAVNLSWRTGTWSWEGEVGAQVDGSRYSGLNWFGDGIKIAKPLGSNYGEQLGKISYINLSLFSKIRILWWIEADRSISLGIGARESMFNIISDQSLSGNSSVRNLNAELGYHRNW